VVDVEGDTLIGAQLLDSFDKRRYDRALTLMRSLHPAYRATGEGSRDLLNAARPCG
jgi:hypothetical protein